MNTTSVPFAFSALLNPPAQQSGYRSLSNFVTNSGLYNVTVSEARYGTRTIKGMARTTIELRCVAVHKLHPEHMGRLMLKIDMPNPNEAHFSDYTYQSLCVAANVVEQRQGPDGQPILVPNFGEQVVSTTFEGNVTELTALAGKRLIVNVTRREYKGRGFLGANAVFDEAGYSGREIATGVKQQGGKPHDITLCDMAYEGLPLEPVQRDSASAQTSSGFGAPQAVNDFAAPQPQQPPVANAPSAPQPMPPAAFSNQQSQQAAANPYAQMQQGNPQQPQPQQSNYTSPYGKPQGGDDDIPF